MKPAEPHRVTPTNDKSPDRCPAWKDGEHLFSAITQDLDDVVAFDERVSSKACLVRTDGLCQAEAEEQEVTSRQLGTVTLNCADGS